jgi:transcriptional regulator with XRE-family HTH domain
MSQRQVGGIRVAPAISRRPQRQSRDIHLPRPSVPCDQYRNINHKKRIIFLRPLAPLRKIPPDQEGVGSVPKEKPKVNIGEVIRSYRGQRGLSQGDIERRTGLLRCYLSRVENGHTVPSLETLAKIAEAMEIALADFFPGAETPRDRDTQKMLGELSEDEIRFLSEIKKYSTTLSDGDKRLVLAMIRKMATVIPPPPRKMAPRRSAY